MNSFASQVRGAARALLPEGAFLRRDRGEALFVTDAPRFGGSVDWAGAGFLCRAGHLARLTPGPEWLYRLEGSCPEPPDALSTSFQRFSGDIDVEALSLFAEGMKALDGGTWDAKYDRRLRQRAAVCLRERLPGGGLYACALVRYLIEKERGI